MKCVSIAIALTALLQTASSTATNPPPANRLIRRRGGGEGWETISWQHLHAAETEEQGCFPHEHWENGRPPARHSKAAPPLQLNLSKNNVVVTGTENDAAREGAPGPQSPQGPMPSSPRSFRARQRMRHGSTHRWWGKSGAAVDAETRGSSDGAYALRQQLLGTTTNDVVQQEPNTSGVTAADQYAERLTCEEVIALAGRIYEGHNPREPETAEKQQEVRAPSPPSKIRDSLKKHLSPKLGGRKLFKSKRGSENRVEITVA